eukprot:Sspe_Gene.75928::Locus_47442_Transcript_1_1_Confidence_1.000_Length_5064::g.75928::m.75928
MGSKRRMRIMPLRDVQSAPCIVEPHFESSMVASRSAAALEKQLKRLGHPVKKPIGDPPRQARRLIISSKQLRDDSDFTKSSSQAHGWRSDTEVVLTAVAHDMGKLDEMLNVDDRWKHAQKRAEMLLGSTSRTADMRTLLHGSKDSDDDDGDGKSKNSSSRFDNHLVTQLEKLCALHPQGHFGVLSRLVDLAHDSPFVDRESKEKLSAISNHLHVAEPAKGAHMVSTVKAAVSEDASPEEAIQKPQIKVSDKSVGTDFNEMPPPRQTEQQGADDEARSASADLRCLHAVVATYVGIMRSYLKKAPHFDTDELVGQWLEGYTRQVRSYGIQLKSAKQIRGREHADFKDLLIHALEASTKCTSSTKLIHSAASHLSRLVEYMRGALSLEAIER